MNEKQTLNNFFNDLATKSNNVLEQLSDTLTNSSNNQQKEKTAFGELIESQSWQTEVITMTYEEEIKVLTKKNNDLNNIITNLNNIISKLRADNENLETEITSLKEKNKKKRSVKQKNDKQKSRKKISK